MQIVRQMSDLGRVLGNVCGGGRLALVPTMGALHDGHLALVAEGRRHAGAVVATIFVNPTQFNDPKDLERYPRTEEADLAALEAAGCDAVWLGEVGDLYPAGFATTVSVAGVSERWEGAHRPGHFDGVATIVAKLLVAVMPDVAVFGEKDWQQLAVIRRMAADLGLPVAIHGHPTVREPDGLAMSSRNALLAKGEREQAAALPQALGEAAAAIGAGGEVRGALDTATARIVAAGFGPVDYLAYVDGDTLAPLDGFHPNGRLIAAAFLGKVRLIDNIRVVSDTV